MMNRSEILANRLKWINFLKNPKRKKVEGFLDGGNGYRCCLGHGAYCLGISRQENNDIYTYGSFHEKEVAPSELIELVGLWDNQGSIKNALSYICLNDDVPILDLTSLNDNTEYSPQQIGDYLNSVIEGGEHTPFRPLSEYKENEI